MGCKMMTKALPEDYVRHSEFAIRHFHRKRPTFFGVLTTLSHHEVTSPLFPHRIQPARCRSRRL
jgi:hypothetical protein